MKEAANEDSDDDDETNNVSHYINMFLQENDNLDNIENIDQLLGVQGHQGAGTEDGETFTAEAITLPAKVKVEEEEVSLTVVCFALFVSFFKKKV
jgi:hypothetical protein